MMRTIPIESIRRDASTQTRAGLNAERVADYAERMKAGDEFPTPVVFLDTEDAAHLADGFHRVAALESMGRKRVECDVRKGDAFDAFVFGLEANAKHDKSGLHRSNADKRHSVEALFSWLRKRGEEWSDRRIAEACGVSDRFVNAIRPTANGSQLPRTGSDGKTRHPPRPKADKPKAPKATEPPNAFVAIAGALDRAVTKWDADAAYTMLTKAAAAGEVDLGPVGGGGLFGESEIMGIAGRLLRRRVATEAFPLAASRSAR